MLFKNVATLLNETVVEIGEENKWGENGRGVNKIQ